MTLNDFFLALIGTPAPGGAHRVFPHPWWLLSPVSGVVIDSRQATAGSVFVALPGEQTDGHLYVPDAFARGAIAAIVEKPGDAFPTGGAAVLDLRSLRSDDFSRSLRSDDFSRSPRSDDFSRSPPPICLRVEHTLVALQRVATRWRARFDIRAIGITGSIGKTTTKELVASVLAQRYCVLKSEGNYNNEIGLPLTLLRLNDRHQRAVLEMGTYGMGEIARLADIARPSIGIVTNVGPVHLERMGSIERIAQAKSELPQALPADGVAILNGDDQQVRRMARKTRARVLFYGRNPGCDLWASNVDSQGLQGLHLQFHWQAQVIQAHIPLPGQHNVYTALCAAAVGLVEGLSWPEILAGLQGGPDRTGRQGRLLAVPGIEGATLLNDTYNSSPDSAIAALDLLHELDGRKIAVLGDMLELGEYTVAGHRRVGCRAAEVASILVAVGKLGRLIGEQALHCGMPAARVVLAADNAAAVAHLQGLIQEGDIVLIKGSRGMAMEQIVAALARLPANGRGDGRLAVDGSNP